MRKITVAAAAGALALLVVALAAASGRLPMPFAQPAVQPGAAMMVQVGLRPAVVQLDIGQSATVMVDATSSAEAIYGAQFEVRFNPAVLSILFAGPGPLLSGNGQEDQAGGFFKHFGIDNASGTLLFASTLLSPAAPSGGAGDVAQMMVFCKAKGRSPLDISSPVLANATGEEILSQSGGDSIVLCGGVPLEETVEIPVVVGFNLMSLPVGCDEPLSAKDLADVIAAQGGVVDSVQRWGVGGAQGFDGWLPGSSNPFLLQPGHGYFVKLSAIPGSGSVGVTGVPCNQSAPLDFLVPGFNLVGVPYSTPAGGHDAGTLSGLIQVAGGVVDSVQRWGVGGSQGFDGWLPGATGPFAISRLAGYFIKLSQVPGTPVLP